MSACPTRSVSSASNSIIAREAPVHKVTVSAGRDQAFDRRASNTILNLLSFLGTKKTPVVSVTSPKSIKPDRPSRQTNSSQASSCSKAGSE